jgi:hypothetical protein
MFWICVVKKLAKDRAQLWALGFLVLNLSAILLGLVDS